MSLLESDFSFLLLLRNKRRDAKTTQIRGKNTCQVDELRQFELDADFEDVAVVDDGSDNLVVIGEQVVIESFGVWIAAAGRLDQEAETPAAAHGRQHQGPGSGRARQSASAPITWSSFLSVGHR